MKLRPLFALLALPFFTLACASSSNTIGGAASFGDADYSSSDDYDVKIVQTANPMSFPRADDGRLDVSFDITIKNLRTEPVTIERISLQSMSGRSYTLETSTRKYERAIPAGGTETFKYWTHARVDGTVLEASAPMVVRALVDTVIGDGKQRETFNREVHNGYVIGAQISGSR